MNHHKATWRRTRVIALLRRISCWTLLSFWVMQASPIWAAERAILGNAQAIPLAVSANPDAARSLNVLRQQVADKGTARIIVGVRVAFAPEAKLAPASVTQQRNEIALAHSAVLDKVPSLKRKPDTIKRFETIPFMALEVTPAELEQLAALTEITSIEEDRLSFQELAQSVPLIGGPTAWASGYTGAGQTVAILDAGVDKTHPFLTGKVVSEACYSTTAGNSLSICPGGAASSTASGSAMPYATRVCVAGECDHGTHVAGIAAGTNASFSGVAKGATVIAVQVFSQFSASESACGGVACAMSYDSDQISGLERIYALRSTYRIAAVNMSLGGGSYSSQSTCDAANLSQKAAIDNLRAVNIATVISSGNSGYTDSMSAPGCISSAISVGATWDAAGSNNSCAGNSLGTSSVDAIACYSDSAWFLSLLAPGSLITSSIPGTAYATWQGTSMAAPHVTGAWALLKQKAPAATVNEVLAALASSGVPVTDTRNGITKPRISLSAALNALVTGVSYTLSVTKAGAGTGTISSSPAGIACSTSCSASFASGTLLTLNATGTGTGVFTGWSGACSGTGTCSIVMSADQSVTATFAVGTVVTPISQTNLSGAAGSARYFSVVVPAGASNLVIQTSGGTGDVDLYVRATAAPTLSVYDCAPLTNGNNETCTFPTPLATTYNIMLYGYAAYSGVSLTVSYTTAPVTLPAAPTIGTAIPGNTSISVAFTPGAIGSGSLISYWADCTKDYVTYFSAAGSNSPINVPGLVNGSAYSCYAFTQSTVGYSPWSAASNSVIPAAPPGAPTNITVIPYPGRLQVSFTAPANTGGSTITGYTVTCTAAGQTTRTNTGASSPISVYGLTPGVAYSCTVTASNTAATSAPSTPVTSTARSIDMTPILMLLLDD